MVYLPVTVTIVITSLDHNYHLLFIPFDFCKYLVISKGHVFQEPEGHLHQRIPGPRTEEIDLRAVDESRKSSTP